MDSEQKSLAHSEEPDIVEYDRNNRRVSCPDCDEDITHSKGMHRAPTRHGTVPIHGWRCDQCNNICPANCHGSDAPGYIAHVTGMVVEFRDGERRWVAVSESSAKGDKDDAE